MTRQNADYGAALPPMCDGDVCVECCLCVKCGRKVGTRHLDVCACPPEGRHFRCPDCAAERIADVLAPYPDGQFGGQR
jgi:hypothetical protein